MKKFVLSAALVVFALTVQAGDDGSCSAGGAPCCAAKNASVQAKAECSASKQAKNTSTKAKEAGTKQASAKQLKSPKATG